MYFKASAIQTSELAEMWTCQGICQQALSYLSSSNERTLHPEQKQICTVKTGNVVHWCQWKVPPHPFPNTCSQAPKSPSSSGSPNYCSTHISSLPLSAPANGLSWKWPHHCMPQLHKLWWPRLGATDILLVLCRAVETQRYTRSWPGGTLGIACWNCYTFLVVLILQGIFTFASHVA